MTPSRKRQLGFSLMELLIALMIIGVIATLGFRGLTRNADKARYIQAQDRLRIVAQGLDQYHLQNGKYPDFSSWEQMIDANSPLVKKNFIPVNVPPVDGWQQPFEGKSGKQLYELKAAGDPGEPEERGPIVIRPGEISGGSTQGSSKPEGSGPAPGAAK